MMQRRDFLKGLALAPLAAANQGTLSRTTDPASYCGLPSVASTGDLVRRSDLLYRDAGILSPGNGLTRDELFLVSRGTLARQQTGEMVPLINGHPAENEPAPVVGWVENIRLELRREFALEWRMVGDLRILRDRKHLTRNGLCVCPTICRMPNGDAWIDQVALLDRLCAFRYRDDVVLGLPVIQSLTTGTG